MLVLKCVSIVSVVIVFHFLVLCCAVCFAVLCIVKEKRKMQGKSIRSHGFCFGALFIKDLKESDLCKDSPLQITTRDTTYFL